jgi:protein-disulfide isomerase
MRLGLKALAVLMCMIATAVAAGGNIAELLAPPAGTRVAMVVFEDLEWPDCASAYPVLVEAARTHNVPLVVHDFPLPRHNWSFQAAVNARFFQQRSEQLGRDFRGYILENQKQIGDETGLQRYTEKFASERRIPLPATLDPDGKLAEQVMADFRLGQRIGVEHTPTVFVVSLNAPAHPLVETIDRKDLERVIEEAQKKAGAMAPAGNAPKKKNRS